MSPSHVTCHQVMSHVTKSCHTSPSHVTCHQVMSHVTKSCHMSPSHVTRHQVMSHVTKSCHTSPSHVTCHQVMSHVTKSCHMSPSHVTRHQVMSHVINGIHNCVGCTSIFDPTYFLLFLLFLFNDATGTHWFLSYHRLLDVIHMVMLTHFLEGNPLPPHRLLFSISSNRPDIRASC